MSQKPVYTAVIGKEIDPRLLTRRPRCRKLLSFAETIMVHNELRSQRRAWLPRSMIEDLEHGGIK
jgi:hypothetical protein